MSVTLEQLLPVIQSRKNEIPGAADVGGMSPFEIWFGRKPVLPQSLNSTRAPLAELHGPYGVQLRQLDAIHRRIDAILRSAATQKLLQQALSKKLKPDRSVTEGQEVYFFTTKGGKVKTEGWRALQSFCK